MPRARYARYYCSHLQDKFTTLYELYGITDTPTQRGRRGTNPQRPLFSPNN